MRLAMLTVVPLDEDPRARRAANAAGKLGIQVSKISVARGSARAARPKASTSFAREMRGLIRLLRLGMRTGQLLRASKGVHAEVVHAHDLDTLPAGAVLAHRNRSRLVYDAHELYTGFDYEPPRLWLTAVSRLEGALCRRADSVVTVSNQIADELVRRHNLSRRPYIVLNCPPLEDAEIGLHTGSLRVIYQAAVGPGRTLDDLPDVPGVDLHARVLGATSAPTHVRLHPPVEPAELIRALAPYDVGLVIDRPETDNARFALPNKLFEYLMAGLAVVVPDVPAMSRLVEREGVGRTYGAGRLADVLTEIAADRPALEEMRRRARRAAVERYNAEAQCPALYAAWGL
jgi:glycogen synthase